MCKEVCVKLQLLLNGVNQEAQVSRRSTSEADGSSCTHLFNNGLITVNTEHSGA